MKKNILILFILLIPFLCGSTVNAQNLPTKEWSASTHNKPLLFYISGDGGFNKFSIEICESLNKQDYDVIALNAKSYFWNKKTPEQTANDINNYLSKKLLGRQNQQVVLIGYSFGADVVPFILNKLPKDMDDKILVSFLMASSGSTDFEIHWADILGGNSKRRMDVITELNKLTNEHIVIISASDDLNLDPNKITLKKYTREVLPGGHHLDGDTDEIIKVILSKIN
jgi:type IV secretory pathway VirJ component